MESQEPHEVNCLLDDAGINCLVSNCKPSTFGITLIPKFPTKLSKVNVSATKLFKEPVDLPLADMYDENSNP